LGHGRVMIKYDPDARNTYRHQTPRTTFV